jgi:hypothetical protein
VVAQVDAAVVLVGTPRLVSSRGSDFWIRLKAAVSGDAAQMATKEKQELQLGWRVAPFMWAAAEATWAALARAGAPSTTGPILPALGSGPDGKCGH